jgi:hypothetical protein
MYFLYVYIFCLFKQISLLDLSDVCLISVPLFSESVTKSAEAA